jgi:hypothetical protein
LDFFWQGVLYVGVYSQTATTGNVSQSVNHGGKKLYFIPAGPQDHVSTKTDLLTMRAQTPYPQVVLFGDSLFEGCVDVQDGFSFYATFQQRMSSMSLT